MTKLLPLLLFLSLACFAGELLEKAKCDSVMEIKISYMEKGINEKNDSLFNLGFFLAYTGERVKCECLQKISCKGYKNSNFCISYKCPNSDKPVSIFADDGIQCFAANVGRSGSNSGNSGQPKGTK